jgi:hypothetical protein
MSSQPPKDFLALTHGHEWVNFYESFDKLVQDHLSRSSELLQKAMSLPEVADREVAELRETLEQQLKTERAQANETLTSLRSEISTTQQQAVSVAALTAQLAADLNKLSDKVDGALASLIDSGADIAATLDAITDANDEPQDEGDLAVDDTHGAEPKPVEVVPEDESAGEILDEVSMADVADWSEAANEGDLDADESGEIDLSALAAAETGLPVAEVEQKIGTGEIGGTSVKPDTGDLASILEAADAEGEFAASTTVNGASELGQNRSRPHWLSMSRSTDEQEPS